MWTSMDIDVLLLGRAFGWFYIRVVIVSINQDKQLSETNSNKFVKKREVDVNDHGTDYVVTGHAVPCLVEVSLLSIEYIFSKRVSCCCELTFEISVYEQKEETSVEDVTNENVPCNDRILTRFCGAANKLEQWVNYQFDYHISNNDKIVA